VPDVTTGLAAPKPEKRRTARQLPARGTFQTESLCSSRSSPSKRNVAVVSGNLRPWDTAVCGPAPVGRCRFRHRVERGEFVRDDFDDSPRFTVASRELAGLFKTLDANRRTFAKGLCILGQPLPQHNPMPSDGIDEAGAALHILVDGNIEIANRLACFREANF